MEKTNKINRILSIILIIMFIFQLNCNLSYVCSGIPTTINEDNSRIPLNWAIISLGGHDYYRELRYNAIQRIEKMVHSRGVPFDLFGDVNISAPKDNIVENKYPLQYLNGSIKYKVIILFYDWCLTRSAVNTNYINTF